MNPTMDAEITIKAVSQRLGLSKARIYQLDPVLKPRRGPTGYRLYDAAHVEAIAAARATAKTIRASGRKLSCARVQWIRALSIAPPGPARIAEIRQMLVDVMGAAGDASDEARIVAALSAFDRER